MCMCASLDNRYKEHWNLSVLSVCLCLRKHLLGRNHHPGLCSGSTAGSLLEQRIRDSYFFFFCIFCCLSNINQVFFPQKILLPAEEFAEEGIYFLEEECKAENMHAHAQLWTRYFYYGHFVLPLNHCRALKCFWKKAVIPASLPKPKWRIFMEDKINMLVVFVHFLL